ncbi:hypothetical protein ACIOG8_00160 [Streptomyces erythrochromogenes]|uniref:hypothetical protein n=1 Tax=Streptomyces erythrochromogenes TaxID=285574 RepID=UPI003806F475
MQAWQVGLAVGICGGLGGVVSAALSEDRGFVLPNPKKAPDGTTIIRPGFLGQILVGIVAAFVSWGLYGPFTAAMFIGGPTNPDKDKYGLTFAAAAGAIGVGIGGARWLSNYVDKELYQKAASLAAGRSGNASQEVRMAHAAPTEAMDIAASLDPVGDQTADPPAT